MNIQQTLLERANHKCELCSSQEQLSAFQPKPKKGESVDLFLLACEKCLSQLKGEQELEVNHWRCLNDSIWSDYAAVKVVAWRVLSQLKNEGWPLDLLEMMYLDEETQKWAESEDENVENEVLIHKDSNGAILSAGDTVVLIKDLNVKGANFTAKRGTAVRNISLVHDNAEQVEGRVNGQHIVILTQYVKKNS